MGIEELEVDVERLDAFTLSAYPFPSSLKPVAQDLIEMTPIETKEVLSTIDPIIYENTLVVTSDIVFLNCGLKDRNYSISEAEKRTKEYAAKTLAEERMFYTRRQYKAVKKLYRLAVEIGVSSQCNYLDY